MGLAVVTAAATGTETPDDLGRETIASGNRVHAAGPPAVQDNRDHSHDAIFQWPDPRRVDGPSSFDCRVEVAPVGVATLKTSEEIIAYLRLLGLGDLADRVSQVKADLEDDPFDPPLQTESLRGFTTFVTEQRGLRRPNVTGNPRGLIHSQWSVYEQGTVVLEFQSSECVRFAAVSAPADQAMERDCVYGTCRVRDVMNKLTAFRGELLP